MFYYDVKARFPFGENFVDDALFLRHFAHLLR